LKVIPVIDILNGIVVHAVRGKRSKYQPLRSVLSNSVDPLEVAKTFKVLGFRELYIADLDAIIDCSANFQPLKRIADETGLRLMVDAGVTSLERARLLLESGVSKLVVGTETLESEGFVGEAVRAFGSERVVVSLDLKGDAVIVKPVFEGCREAIGLLRNFRGMGVSQVIVLDLARVGSGEGVNVDFLNRLKDAAPMDFYVGGGVRGIDDLEELMSTGISGVLVATALHSGKITVAKLRQKGLV